MPFLHDNLDHKLYLCKAQLFSHLCIGAKVNDGLLLFCGVSHDVAAKPALVGQVPLRCPGPRHLNQWPMSQRGMRWARVKAYGRTVEYHKGPVAFCFIYTNTQPSVTSYLEGPTDERAMIAHEGVVKERMGALCFVWVETSWSKRDRWSRVGRSVGGTHDYLN